MRLLSTVFSLALASNTVLGSSWFSKAGKYMHPIPMSLNYWLTTIPHVSAYNKWHETELERWLSDHDIPYPTPADRKDLENLVQKNWEDYAVSPYKSWDSEKLQAYLKAKGIETKDAAQDTKDSLVSQVQTSWYETEDKAQSGWGSVKDWILDTWTESHLKAFADKHGIPGMVTPSAIRKHIYKLTLLFLVPQPRTRDTLLQKIRSNYETIAKKVGETAAYPGNWLYETWSESDLKEWLDTHGFPAPQPSTVRHSFLSNLSESIR